MHLSLPWQFLLSSNSMKSCGNSPSTAQNHSLFQFQPDTAIWKQTDVARLNMANNQDNSDNYNCRIPFLLAHRPPTLLSFRSQQKQVIIKQPVNEDCCHPVCTSGLSCATAPRLWMTILYSSKIWCSQSWEESGGTIKGRKPKKMSGLEGVA